MPVDHSGRTHADRWCPVAPGDRGRADGPVQLGHHGGDRVGHVVSGDGVRAARSGRAGLGHDPAVGAERDAEDLGAADVDAVRDAGSRRVTVMGHDVDSTRAFSSRMAVVMMRLVARILMKPGMGTRSSASRW